VVIRCNRLVNCTAGIVVDSVSGNGNVADNLIIKSVVDRNAGLQIALG